ncbi:MAG: hypothetical protein QNJ04_10945 [Desulfobacterales bacterium]|nr:hypothetical protein [Desulfobacterales bacterium]
MIKSHTEIYEDYRQADFSDRLSIYLQYPELRNDFLEIDLHEGSARASRARDSIGGKHQSLKPNERFRRFFPFGGFPRRLKDPR